MKKIKKECKNEFISKRELKKYYEEKENNAIKAGLLIIATSGWTILAILSICFLSRNATEITGTWQGILIVTVTIGTLITIISGGIAIIIHKTEKPWEKDQQKEVNQ